MTESRRFIQYVEIRDRKFDSVEAVPFMHSDTAKKVTDVDNSTA